MDWFEMFWRGRLIDELTDDELIGAWRVNHALLGRSLGFDKRYHSIQPNHFRASCAAFVKEMKCRKQRPRCATCSDA